MSSHLCPGLKTTLALRPSFAVGVAPRRGQLWTMNDGYLLRPNDHTGDRSVRYASQGEQQRLVEFVRLLHISKAQPYEGR